MPDDLRVAWTWTTRVFALVVLIMLAGDWVIHTHATQWFYGAVAGFVASFLPSHDQSDAR